VLRGYSAAAKQTDTPRHPTTDQPTTTCSKRHAATPHDTGWHDQELALSSGSGEFESRRRLEIHSYEIWPTQHSTPSLAHDVNVADRCRPPPHSTGGHAGEQTMFEQARLRMASWTSARRSVRTRSFRKPLIQPEGAFDRPADLAKTGAVLDAAAGG
jgi:hypothetical protein